jgi:hypothetical protein
MKRPQPPAELADKLRLPEQFAPAPELLEWALATFVARDSKLFNPEHAHLAHATVGFLWTNVANRKNQRVIVGQAEAPQGKGSWGSARSMFQLRRWFGHDLDFLITIDAVYAAGCTDAMFCGLIEHELYHCAQARDQYGVPKFTKEGRPVFGLRGHDVEEFIGVVRRYGVGAAAGGVAELVAAAKQKPEIAAVAVAGACGTCLSRR